MRGIKIKSLMCVTLSCLLIFSVGLLQGCNSSNSQAQSNTVNFTLDMAGHNESVLAEDFSSLTTIAIMNGISNELGPTLVALSLEYQATNVPCTTPLGSEGIIFSLTQGSAVVTQIATNDQLFANIDSLDLCTSLADPSQGTSGSGVFIGGTGQFQNASGQFTSSGTGTVFTMDGSFGGQSVIVTGSVDLN